MNITVLEERLKILVDSQVVSNRANEVTISAFLHLSEKLGNEDIEQAEMLFTHLPVALTRIEKGEKVEAPFPEMLEEVKQSPYFDSAMKKIEHVQKQWHACLPQEELDYLLIHYATVLQINDRGNE